jgi:hypothetical protein
VKTLLLAAFAAESLHEAPQHAVHPATHTQAEVIIVLLILVLLFK